MRKLWPLGIALVLCASPTAAEVDLTAVPLFPTNLCVTSGHLSPLRGDRFRVDAPGMRAVAAAEPGPWAGLRFVYLGASAESAPLANGELRRQIGLKLRAQDTCNVVYIMWRLSPSPGIAVSVKVNPGQARHAQCGDRGYLNLTPERSAAPPSVALGERHQLTALLKGGQLDVFADGNLVWQGTVPSPTFTFDGPAGIRTDNGVFEFELRVPRGRRQMRCPADLVID